MNHFHKFEIQEGRIYSYLSTTCKHLAITDQWGEFRDIMITIEKTLEDTINLHKSKTKYRNIKYGKYLDLVELELINAWDEIQILLLHSS